MISPETLIFFFFFPQQMKAIQRFLPFKPLKQFFQESCCRSPGAAGELLASGSSLGIPEAECAQSEGSAGTTRQQQEMQTLPLITSSLLLLGALCEGRASQVSFPSSHQLQTNGKDGNDGPLGSPPAQHLLGSV